MEIWILTTEDFSRSTFFLISFGRSPVRASGWTNPDSACFAGFVLDVIGNSRTTWSNGRRVFELKGPVRSLSVWAEEWSKMVHLLAALVSS